MSILAITYTTESPNTLIRSSRWNQNFNDIITFMNNKNLDSNDNIKDTGISTAALANLAVTDAKIAGITTAGKVDGNALVNLGNIPNTSGNIPQANLPTIDVAGKLDGKAFTDLANIPVGAGLIPAVNITTPAIPSNVLRTFTGLSGNNSYYQDDGEYFYLSIGKDSNGALQIASGLSALGTAIPLPTGCIQANCTWIVSIARINQNDTAGNGFEVQINSSRIVSARERANNWVG